MCLQHGHVRLVLRGLTANTSPPAQAGLYSSCRLNTNQPWSRMERFVAHAFLFEFGKVSTFSEEVSETRL